MNNKKITANIILHNFKVFQIEKRLFKPASGVVQLKVELKLLIKEFSQKPMYRNKFLMITKIKKEKLPLLRFCFAHIESKLVWKGEKVFISKFPFFSHNFDFYPLIF